MARVPSVAQTEAAFRPLATTGRKLAVTGRSCANCGSSEIRPSATRNTMDVLLACIFLTPFRCKVCRVRFYLMWRPSLQRPPEPPVAPLLVMPPRDKVLNLDWIEPRQIQPEPIHPQGSGPQMAPLPTMEFAVMQPPVNSDPVGFQQSPTQPLTANGPGRILILENDLSIRKLLRRLLERRGHLTVEIAQTGDLARELRDRRADLLIMDVSTTPGGVQAAVALAYIHPDLKILALSAESFDNNTVPGRLLALRKPFPLDSFVDSVDRLMKPSPAVAVEHEVRRRLDHS